MTKHRSGTIFFYVVSGIVARSPLLLGLATVTWAATVASGMGLLFRYKNTPGAVAVPPVDWPAGTPVVRSTERPTLVMLAHPRCPCTRASVSELARVMSQVGASVDAHVFILKPSGTEEGWEKTDLWRRAQAIPGVRVAVDEDGAAAARFGATVSGQVVLYDARGRLLFRGGITGGRGHEGDNAGRLRLASLIRTGAADAATSRVFGCSLKAPAAGS